MTWTVAPASPVPVSVVPSALTVATGAPGAVVSVVVAVVGGETLPAASAWVTVRTWPSAVPAGSVTLYVPSVATVAVPSGWPLASET